MRRPMAAVVLAAAALTLCGAARAVVPGTEEAIRLSYRASPGCPDEANFVARLCARTSRARIARAGESARTFTIVVDAGPPASGRVVVHGADDASEGTRQVRAASCTDVADALALMVALAIDPQAAAPERAASARPSPPEPPAPSASSAPAAVQPSADDEALSAGGDFVAVTDVTPQVLLAGSPYVGWRAPAVGWFEPSFRLAFVRAGTPALDVPGGTAAFTWTVGRADACPIALPRGVVRVVECVRLEAGSLQVEQALRPWVAVGPVVRAGWSFLSWAFVEGEAGVLVHVTQDRFYFTGQPTAYEVHLLGGTVGVGVGVHFL